MKYLLLLLCGCSSFSSIQERVHPDGMLERTEVRITTKFDSHNEVGKLRTTMTDKSQGIGVGSITENSSSTNFVDLLHEFGNILKAIPK